MTPGHALDFIAAQTQLTNVALLATFRKVVTAGLCYAVYLAVSSIMVGVVAGG